MTFLYRLTAFWYSRIAFFVFLFIAAAVVYVAVVPFAGQSEFYGVALAVSLLVEQCRKEGRWYMLGFPWRWMPRHTATGLMLALGMIAAIGLAALVLGAGWRLSGPVETETVWWTLFIFCVYAGGEEVLFRGVVFQALLERFGATTAIVLSSAFFAVAHLANPDITPVALVNLVLAGVLFSWMYIQTRALWMPWAFHFGWNAAQRLLLGSAVSGLQLGGVVFELDMPDSAAISLIVGGEFGVEGGLLTTVLLLVGIAVVALPQVAQVPPELAARLFRRQYAESVIRHILQVPWGRWRRETPEQRPGSPSA